MQRLQTVLLVLALALSLAFTLTSAGAQAAEIVCLQRFGDSPVGAVYTKKIWPSGFRPSVETCLEALLRGPIEKGDYERYVAFYRQHHRGLTSLLRLQSPGGDVGEAIKIGRTVRKYFISAIAPVYSHIDRKNMMLTLDKTVCDGGPDCVCASACALIWFGAVDRTGRVGLHRPKFTDPAFGALPPDAASLVYRQALRDISQYLEEMEAPRPLIDAMVATGSSEIHWVDAFDQKSLDAQLRQPPSWREWLDASCGSLTFQEGKLHAELGTRPLRGLKLTEQEQMLLKLLDDKISNRFLCIGDLAHKRRDALPAP